MALCSLEAIDREIVSSNPQRQLRQGSPEHLYVEQLTGRIVDALSVVATPPVVPEPLKKRVEAGMDSLRHWNMGAFRAWHAFVLEKSWESSATPALGRPRF